jgi:predicted nuclease of restriction endonuclease-like (RecB) superfamily
MAEIVKNDDYKVWLNELKSTIQRSQIKAALSVNAELIGLYWELGRQISEKQKSASWGDKILSQLAKDLKTEFPEMGGFSKTNLVYCRKFFQFYTEDIDKKPFIESPELPTVIGEQLVHQFDEQLVRQIPWGHHLVILKKVKSPSEAIFYIQETIGNNWSRSILEIQIESKLFERQGKSVNNFENTLPKPQSDLANQIIKDPYNFSFLTLEKNVQELEFERQLTRNITDFLLELGKGFAFVGRQYALQVGEKEYKIDLLFYHLKLRCYIVIELKMREFEPEFVGKLNFYLSAVDSLIKSDDDKPTIGILLCKNKDNFEVEFALRDVHKPIGISEFSFNELPTEIKNAMPTVEEFEKHLAN